VIKASPGQQEGEARQALKARKVTKAIRGKSAPKASKAQQGLKACKEKRETRENQAPKGQPEQVVHPCVSKTATGSFSAFW
jgi:hypothetical protein